MICVSPLASLTARTKHWHALDILVKNRGVLANCGFVCRPLATHQDDRKSLEVSNGPKPPQRPLNGHLEARFSGVVEIGKPEQAGALPSIASIEGCQRSCQVFDLSRGEEPWIGGLGSSIRF